MAAVSPNLGRSGRPDRHGPHGSQIRADSEASDGGNVGGFAAVQCLCSVDRGGFLEGRDLDGLRRQWRAHLGGEAPAHLPRWLLMRVLAYRLQSDAFGDLDKSIRRNLRSEKDDGAGVPFDRRAPQTWQGVALKAGALLVREWKGRLERVMILEEGFAWNGQTFGSLSQIAKAMTGTNWNGHRFFGLRQGKVDAAGHGSGRRKGEASAGARTEHGASLGSRPDEEFDNQAGLAMCRSYTQRAHFGRICSRSSWMAAARAASSSNGSLGATGGAAAGSGAGLTVGGASMAVRRGFDGRRLRPDAAALRRLVVPDRIAMGAAAVGIAVVSAAASRIGFMAFAPLSSSPTTAPGRCLMVSSVPPATRQPRTIRRLSRETKVDANKREKARRRVCLEVAS